MSSLEGSVSKLIKAYKSLDLSTLKREEVCRYNPATDEIAVNFDEPVTPLDYFKLLHELAHKTERDVHMLYGNTACIELNANKIAFEAFKRLGFHPTYEVIRHINYNNVRNLNGDLTDEEIIRKIDGVGETIWRL